MRKVVVECMFAVLLLLPAMAQENTVSKAEVFGGYQYLHLGSDTSLGSGGSGQGFNGWNAAAQVNFSRFLGVEGDFSGSYASISGVSTHVYTYAGGPVIFAEMDRIKPFAHVLFGGTRLGGSESGVSISWDGYTVLAGGGVDAKVNRNLAVRVAQVDWLYYHFGSKTIAGVQFPTITGSNNVRISTGVVLRF
jgi:opacity protein-like surface antigen